MAHATHQPMLDLLSMRWSQTWGCSAQKWRAAHQALVAKIAVKKKRRKPSKCNWSPLHSRKLSSVTNVLRWQCSETDFSFLSRRHQIEFGFYKRNILIMLQSGQLKQNWYRNIIKHHFNRVWLSSRGANIIMLQQSSLGTGLAEQLLSALRKIISVTVTSPAWVV